MTMTEQEMAMLAQGPGGAPAGDPMRMELNARAEAMGLPPEVVDAVLARREQQAAPPSAEERYEAYHSGGARRYAGEAAGSVLGAMGMAAGPAGTPATQDLGGIPGESPAELTGRRSAQGKAASGLRPGIVEGLEGSMAEQQSLSRHLGGMERYYREPYRGQPEMNPERAAHAGAKADAYATKAADIGRRAEVASRGQQSGWYDRVARGLQGPRLPGAPRTEGGAMGAVGAVAAPLVAGGAPLVQAGRELAKAGTPQDALMRLARTVQGPAQTYHFRGPGGDLLEQLAADPALLEWAVANGMISDEVHALVAGQPDMMAGG